MNRAPIFLGLALVVAAIAPNNAQTIEQKEIPLTRIEERVQTGQYTVAQGNIMDGFTYSLRFTQPNGQEGGLTSGQAYPDIWNGVCVDRPTTAQQLAEQQIWDCITQGTEIELTIPSQEIDYVQVTFDPNIAYNDEHQPITQQKTYLPQSVSMTSDSNKELSRFSFPVSFFNTQNEYDKLFCLIEITFLNGNHCEIGCALEQKI